MSAAPANIELIVPFSTSGLGRTMCSIEVRPRTLNTFPTDEIGLTFSYRPPTKGSSSVDDDSMCPIRRAVPPSARK